MPARPLLNPRKVKAVDAFTSIEMEPIFNGALPVFRIGISSVSEPPHPVCVKALGSDVKIGDVP
jgi:hypothetical protein